MVTSFVFNVRNLPAALYKALGGFATNGVNMTKLESYMVGGEFTATQFLAEVDGHPDDLPVKRALEELEFFTTEVKVLGVYPADPFRAVTDRGPRSCGVVVTSPEHRALRVGEHAIRPHRVRRTPGPTDRPAELLGPGHAGVDVVDVEVDVPVRRRPSGSIGGTIDPPTWRPLALLSTV